MENYNNQNTYTKAKSALISINANCDYKTWTDICASCVATKVLTVEDFIDWSRSSPDFPGKSECITKWKSFDGNGGITDATLYYHAKQAGWSYQEFQNDVNPTKNLSLAKQSSVFNIPITENPFAREIWEKCIPADESHEYIKRKKGSSVGVRVYPNEAPPIIYKKDGEDIKQYVQGYLAVPCWLDGKLQTIQFTSPEYCDPPKPKPFLGSTNKNEGWFTVEGSSEKIYITEGIGHAWTCNQLTGYMAIHCFGSGELKKVALTIRSKYPQSELIIVADVGMESKCEEIAREIKGVVLKLPEGMEKNDDINDFYILNGKELTEKLLNSVLKPKLRFKGFRGKDIDSLPDVDWLLEGVFPENGFLVIFGAPGAGKSFLAIDLCMAFAWGFEQWFGRDIKPCSVSYVCLEGEGSFKYRLKAWEKQNKKNIPDNFVLYIDQFKLVTENDKDLNDLADAIMHDAGKNGLIVIDTLARALNGENINESKDMNKIIDSCKKLQTLTNSAVLLVHHCGKDPSKGMMGSNNLLGGGDGVIEVTYSNNQRKWEVFKSKDGITGDSYNFETVSHIVGERFVRGKLKTITSCAISLNENKKPDPIVVDDLPNLKQIVMEEFEKQLFLSTVTGRKGCPKNTKCIDAQQFRNRFKELIPSSYPNRSRDWNRVITSFIKDGYICVDPKDDWFWKA